MNQTSCTSFFAFCLVIWLCTYRYHIFTGMKIHKSQRFWCEQKGKTSGGSAPIRSIRSQRHSATAPQRHSATAPQRHSATAPQRHSATAPQRHGHAPLSAHPKLGARLRWWGAVASSMDILHLPISSNDMDWFCCRKILTGKYHIFFGKISLQGFRLSNFPQQNQSIESNIFQWHLRCWIYHISGWFSPYSFAKKARNFQFWMEIDLQKTPQFQAILAEDLAGQKCVLKFVQLEGSNSRDLRVLVEQSAVLRPTETPKTGNSGG